MFELVDGWPFIEYSNQRSSVNSCTVFTCLFFSFKNLLNSINMDVFVHK